MKAKIRVIRPSSRESNDLLAGRIAEIEAQGFTVLYDDLPRDQDWLYCSAKAKLRAEALENALLEPDTAAVLCARGGYGASDLLPLLNWERLKKAPQKCLIGFSDISALHAALFTKLGWQGLHAPMPATVLWGKQDEFRDINALFEMIRALNDAKPFSQSLDVTGPRGTLEGWLFGGCFSVLTNLIGTPYFPKHLRGAILFLEDTDENPGRLMRTWNQWQQSGMLTGVSGVVIGHLRHLGEKLSDCEPFVYREFAKRTEIPTFMSKDFGHTSPNFPLMLGATAQIKDAKLYWTSMQRIDA